MQSHEKAEVLAILLQSGDSFIQAHVDLHPDISVYLFKWMAAVNIV